MFCLIPHSSSVSPCYSLLMKDLSVGNNLAADLKLIFFFNSQMYEQTLGLTASTERGALPSSGSGCTFWFIAFFFFLLIGISVLINQLEAVTNAKGFFCLQVLTNYISSILFLFLFPILAEIIPGWIPSTADGCSELCPRLKIVLPTQSILLAIFFAISLKMEEQHVAFPESGFISAHIFVAALIAG